ncbi:MAG: beta-propeller domain-containing protein, partial [Desulfurococcales archaeon]|nr:beta-propeller domain-containing protein [Desulfurococcales archaeon]
VEQGCSVYRVFNLGALLIDSVPQMDGTARGVSGKTLMITVALIAVLLGAIVYSTLLRQPQGGESRWETITQTPGMGETTYTPPGRSPGNLYYPATGLGGEGLKYFSSYRELQELLEALSASSIMGPALPAPIPMAIPEALVTPTVTVPTATPAPRVEPGLAGGKIAAPGFAGRVSGTNVQVAGIDEPDIVKTNGDLIVVVAGYAVYVIDARGDVGSLASRIAMEDATATSAFLVGDLLAVFASQGGPVVLEPFIAGDAILEPPPVPPSLMVFYNLSDPSSPVYVGELNVTGSLVSARLSGGVIYAVYRAPIAGLTVPLVNGVPVEPGSIYLVDESPDSYTIIVAVEGETLNYTVKAFLTGPGSRIYMSYERLYVAYTEAPYMGSYGRVEAVFLEALAGLLPDNVSSEIQSLLDRGLIDEANYVAASYLAGLGSTESRSLLAEATQSLGPISEETTVHVFGVSGLSISYNGSFSVPGALLDQFAMEEMDGYFIVATTSREYRLQANLVIPEAGSSATRTVTVLVVECNEACVSRSLKFEVPEDRPRYGARPLIAVWIEPSGETVNNVYIVDLSSMNITSLEGLAPGERIYAARLINGILFLVTFRQVDPLFAINVTDPANPMVVGFLKIPGFSEYLHPVGGDLLLGIGMEENQLKVSLFNVSDPTRMREVSKLLIAKAYSPALYDYHAVTVDYDYKLVLVPLQVLWMPAGIAVIGYEDSSLELVKVLEHAGAQRSIYIGDKLYTISVDRVEVYNITSLELLGSIELET